MQLILLSGGSGKRLFPLSNDVRSKQFLRFLKSEQGHSESMLQRVWKQIEQAQLVPSTWICASKTHLEMVFYQIGQVQHVEEISARDTFPAIVYASAYLNDECGKSDDEVVVFMPVDPMVDAAYFAAIKSLESVLLTSNADIALIGVKPTSPSSRFGYIRVHQDEGTENNYRRVSSFEEKPSSKRAKELIQHGALWNCGVFAFRLSYLKKTLHDMGYATSAAGIRKGFMTLPTTSFDYEIVERAENVVAVPFDGPWADVGTWDVVTEYMADPVVGDGKVIDCSGTHLINELNIPVIVAGIHDAVVICSPDGILVSDKKMTVDMKKFTKDMNNRPMYEERLWGTYHVLDHRAIEAGEEVLVKDLRIYANHNLSYQKHAHRREVWTVVAGNGLFAGECDIREIGPGDVLLIAPGQWHGVKALTELQIIEIQSGDKLVEEDIVRRFMTWDKVEEHFTSTVLQAL